MSSKLFIQCHHGDSNKTLIILPHAGANPSTYLAVLRRIPLNLNSYILSLPGRTFTSHEEVYTDFKKLFTDILNWLASFKGQEIFLLGHSMGALFVYELVKHLEGNNSYNIKAFALSAIKVPDHRFRSVKLSGLPSEEFQKHIEKYHQPPEMIQSQKVIYEAYLRTLKNDFSLIDSYDGQIQFYKNKAKAYILGGTEDSLATEEDLMRWTEILENTEGPLLYQGSHFYIFKHFKDILQQLVGF